MTPSYKNDHNWSTKGQNLNKKAETVTPYWKMAKTFLEHIPSSICCSMFTFFPNRDQQMRSEEARKPRCRPSATNQVARWNGNWTDTCNIIVTAILYFFVTVGLKDKITFSRLSLVISFDNLLPYLAPNDFLTFKTVHIWSKLLGQQVFSSLSSFSWK